MTGSYQNLEWINKGATGTKYVVKYAGLTVRLLAFMLDMLVLSLLSYAVREFLISEEIANNISIIARSFIKIPALPPALEPISSQISELIGNSAINSLLVLSFAFIYFVGFHFSRLQATPGKWIFRIHIINRFGNKPGFLALTFRVLAAIVIFSLSITIGIFVVSLISTFWSYSFILIFLFAYLDLLVILFNERKMALHDFVADTRVMAGPAGNYSQEISHEDEKISSNLSGYSSRNEDSSSKIEGKKNW